MFGMQVFGADDEDLNSLGSHKDTPKNWGNDFHGSTLEALLTTSGPAEVNFRRAEEAAKADKGATPWVILKNHRHHTEQ